MRASGSGVGVRRKGSRGSRGLCERDGRRSTGVREARLRVSRCLFASVPSGTYKPRIVDFPVRRSGATDPGTKSPDCVRSGFATALSARSQDATRARQPRTPAGRPVVLPAFHPTCLRRVDRGARPHRLWRIFQSSSDFLVSSSPFSIPRPPLDARSRVTPASDNQPTTGKRMSTASLAASASLAPRAVPAAGTRRAPRATSRAASRAASPRRRLRRRTPRRAEDAPRDGRPGSRAPGAPGGRVEVVGLEGPPMPLHQRRRGQRRAHRRPRPRFRRALLPLALHRPRARPSRVPRLRAVHARVRLVAQGGGAVLDGILGLAGD